MGEIRKETMLTSLFVQSALRISLLSTVSVLNIFSTVAWNVVSDERGRGKLAHNLFFPGFIGETGTSERTA